MVRRNKLEERAIARSRMERLLLLAEQALPERSDRARRYVDLARRLGMRYQVSLPPAWRWKVCRSCGSLLAPGRNARVRTRGRQRIVTCLACGHVSRFGTAPSGRPAAAGRRTRRAKSARGTENLTNP